MLRAPKFTFDSENHCSFTSSIWEFFVGCDCTVHFSILIRGPDVYSSPSIQLCQPKDASQLDVLYSGERRRVAPVENHWSRDISSSPDCEKSFRKEMSRVAAVTLASKRQNIQRCQRGLAGNPPVTGRNLIRVLAVLWRFSFQAKRWQSFWGASWKIKEMTQIFLTDLRHTEGNWKKKVN